MLLYDWKKVFTASAASARECLRIIKMLTYKEVPKNKYDKIYYYSQLDFRGDSFLVHPEFLIYNAFRHSYHDVGIYLAIASMRSLAEYRATGDTTVDLLACPENPFDYLQSDRLLWLDENGRVHFKYEEVQNTEVKH